MTHQSLKAESLIWLLVLEQWAVIHFKDKEPLIARGPAHRSTGDHVLSVTFSNRDISGNN